MCDILMVHQTYSEVDVLQYACGGNEPVCGDVVCKRAGRLARFVFEFGSQAQGADDHKVGEQQVPVPGRGGGEQWSHVAHQTV